MLFKNHSSSLFSDPCVFFSASFVSVGKRLVIVVTSAVEVDINSQRHPSRKQLLKEVSGIHSLSLDHLCRRHPVKGEWQLIHCVFLFLYIFFLSQNPSVLKETASHTFKATNKPNINQSKTFSSSLWVYFVIYKIIFLVIRNTLLKNSLTLKSEKSTRSTNEVNQNNQTKTQTLASIWIPWWKGESSIFFFFLSSA